ncbi:DUF3299 domain-containing protein [Mesorhizobium sp. INR15]|uniref:DUF3299 domain-containing protein n=1 Tax=Mesorhizobium sp. INR15 TaxID=2654248 RepID=UPI001896955F|nr:DUF3299 domain-containing protein [Mesorhizobium sp. INR15]QPC93029.1 DUF3299 domain-containing protein [Mesorhizobium sp. INR15]
MCKRLKSTIALTSMVVLSVASANASVETMHIFWKDLRPATQVAAESAGLPMIAAKMPDHGETLSLNFQGKTIQLAGYALPVDREGDLVYQFLLVPWTGACSHMPTPPPNQIVLVTPAHPYKMSQAYQAVAVTGALTPDMEKSQLFILDGVSVIQSGYTVRKAEVINVDTVPDTIILPVNSPWSFLNKKN